MPQRTPKIFLARAYALPKKGSELRLLVDRLWPRGVSKESLALDEWCKDLAPSSELRRRFNHRADRWQEFGERYRLELKERQARLAEVAALSRQQPLLLIFGARDVEHSHAIILRECLLETLAKRPDAA